MEELIPHHSSGGVLNIPYLTVLSTIVPNHNSDLIWEALDKYRMTIGIKEFEVLLDKFTRIRIG